MVPMRKLPNANFKLKGFRKVGMSCLELIFNMSTNNLIGAQLMKVAKRFFVSLSNIIEELISLNLGGQSEIFLWIMEEVPRAPAGSG